MIAVAGLDAPEPVSAGEVPPWLSRRHFSSDKLINFDSPVKIEWES